MSDDLTFLASAYLDGDVTADERARVDSDPEALAEVDRLRTVRFLLGDVEPPSISAREAHLSSALDAWERLPDAERTSARRDRTPTGIDGAAVAGAASVSTPSPLRNDRRGTTSTRWLTGAAAALVLVLAGGVALQLRTGTNDDSSSSTDAETAETAETALGLAADAPDASRSDTLSEAATDVAGGGANEVTADVDTGVADPAPSGEDGGLVLLQTTSDLADFASAAVGAPVSPDVPAATSPASDASAPNAESEFPVCPGIDVVVGPAVYGDVLVVVGVDERRNLAIAHGAGTCDEVARVRLP